MQQGEVSGKTCKIVFSNNGIAQYLKVQYLERSAGFYRCSKGKGSSRIDPVILDVISNQVKEIRGIRRTHFQIQFS